MKTKNFASPPCLCLATKGRVSFFFWGIRACGDLALQIAYTEDVSLVPKSVSFPWPPLWHVQLPKKRLKSISERQNKYIPAAHQNDSTWAPFIQLEEKCAAFNWKQPTFMTNREEEKPFWRKVW